MQKDRSDCYTSSWVQKDQIDCHTRSWVQMDQDDFHTSTWVQMDQDDFCKKHMDQNDYHKSSWVQKDQNDYHKSSWVQKDQNDCHKRTWVQKDQNCQNDMASTLNPLSLNPNTHSWLESGTRKTQTEIHTSKPHIVGHIYIVTHTHTGKIDGRPGKHRKSWYMSHFTLCIALTTLRCLITGFTCRWSSLVRSSLNLVSPC